MPTVTFAPHLSLRVLLPAIEFYEAAFGAQVLRTWKNEDGSIHVAEMELGGALFHLHEEVERTGEKSPASLGGVTSLIGVFTEDPAAMVDRALRSGATLINPVTDYDYGYRQGTLADPFGHLWLIQCRI